MSVITVEPLIGGYPDESVLILCDPHHMIIAQPALHTEIPYSIVIARCEGGKHAYQGNKK